MSLRSRAGGRARYKDGRGVRGRARQTRTGVAANAAASSGGQERVRRTRKSAVDEDGGGGKRDSVFGRTRTGAADEVVGRIG